jgi:hypothetical protein
MKNLLFHGVYLSIIAVLSYLYYDKTKTDDYIFEKSNEALVYDYRILNSSNGSTIYEITKNVKRHPKFVEFLDLANKTSDISKALVSKINTYINQKKISIDEVNQLKKDVEISFEQLFSMISNKNREAILKHSQITPLLKDDIFWVTMKKASDERLLNLFNLLKNKIISDEVNVLNYCIDRTTLCEFRYDAFFLAIVPKKAVLIEGEKMEAELYIADYATNSSNLSIKVKNKELSINGGVAKYVEKPKVGKHTIQATAIHKNPLTGEILTANEEFKYEVLPKCSRDCDEK